MSPLHEEIHEPGNDLYFQASSDGFYQVQVSGEHAVLDELVMRITAHRGSGMPRSFRIVAPPLAVVDFSTADPCFILGNGVAGFASLRTAGLAGWRVMFTVSVWMNSQDRLFCNRSMTSISFMGAIAPDVVVGIQPS